MINHFLTNWKTTMAGVLSIIGGITLLVYASPVTEAVIAGAATSILTGIGLLFAKDFNVTGDGK